MIIQFQFNYTHIQLTHLTLSSYWQVQKFVSAKGASFVDAPVSGGAIGAENATLTFMVGGTEADYEQVKNLLECMGQRITHCGGYGMSQAAKLCNNMMLGISMIGVCETMNLAVRLGLDPRTFSDIINSSTGRYAHSNIFTVSHIHSD